MKQNILNLNSLRQFHLNDTPFRWGVENDLIVNNVQAYLSSTWPSSGFVVNKRNQGSDKSYRIAIRSLIAAGDSFKPFPDLCPTWNKLLRELASDAYRETISKITDLNLDSAYLEIMLNEYRSDFFLSPHTDKFPKLVTQLFYFSESWKETWGGQLAILDQEQRPFFSVLPSSGRSVIIVRSKDSWHEVVPVKSGLKNIRRSLQVIFWADKARLLPGRVTY